MTENTNMSEVIEEIKGASEEELKKVIEEHFGKVRAQGMRLGAYLISTAVYDAIEKNLKKGYQSSLRDYQRAIKKVVEIVSVQLNQNETEQNDLVEEEANDGTAE